MCVRIAGISARGQGRAKGQRQRGDTHKPGSLTDKLRVCHVYLNR